MQNNIDLGKFSDSKESIVKLVISQNTDKFWDEHTWTKNILLSLPDATAVDVYNIGKLVKEAEYSGSIIIDDGKLRSKQLWNARTDNLKNQLTLDNLIQDNSDLKDKIVLLIKEHDHLQDEIAKLEEQEVALKRMIAERDVEIQDLEEENNELNNRSLWGLLGAFFCGLWPFNSGDSNDLGPM